MFGPLIDFVSFSIDEMQSRRIYSYAVLVFSYKQSFRDGCCFYNGLFYVKNYFFDAVLVFKIV